MGLFEALGLDIRVLLAQFINFAILIFVLYRFLYTPLFTMMDKRKKTIEEGVKRAEESEQVLVKVKNEAEEIILQAKREAKGIIADAHVVAKQSREVLLERAKIETEAILAVAKKQSEEERKAYVTRLKGEIAQLVIAASEKLVEKHWDSAADKKFIEDTIDKMSSEKK